ncbi:MAG: acyltransferase [candidate division Zixibacteria bacterium]|nr:acyltransferase [candidate division Zixibacteria bacterium]
MAEKLKKAFGYFRGLLLRARLTANGLICSHGPTIIHKSHGSIEVGNRTYLWPDVKLVAAAVDPDQPAVLRIGEKCSLGDRTQIHCGREVTIGNRVLISWDVNIIENEYHGFGGGPARPKSIHIGDEVWIGCRVLVLNGVTIGRGATIGAGSVVTKDIPPYTLAAGNPARAIRKADSWCGGKEEPSSPQSRIHD